MKHRRNDIEKQLGKNAGKGGETKNRRRNRVPIRIALITLLTATASILGLARLSVNLGRVERTYSEILDRDFANMTYIHDISTKLNRHQMNLYHYILEDDAGVLGTLEEDGEKLEQEIRELLEAFGQDMIGSAYESYYHDIYSGLIGYFKNVSIVKEFSRSGSAATAEYYMRTMMEDYIAEVNRNAELLEGLIDEDMERAQSEVDRTISVAHLESIVIVAVVCIAAIASIVLCTRLSDNLAGTDRLTGAANFDRFNLHGERLRRRGRLQNYLCLAVSIRNFKYINQEYGSSAGDEVLRLYAEKLSAHLGKGEMVARSGGDNFLVLLREEKLDAFLRGIGETSVSAGGTGAESQIGISSRCGIYRIAGNATILEACDCATLALNDARKKGTVDVAWFQSDLYGAFVEKKEILARYQTALTEHEFTVYYQPKVDMQTGALWGSEALVRWVREGRVEPPYKFIPILEAEGEIVSLDFYVFETVCRDLRGWLDRGIAPVRVSSNFSKLHLRNEHFAEDVLEIVKRFGIPGELLEVELTESSGYEDFDALKRFEETMRENGIHTSIDDFGTGYSSLSLLKDLDADVVKLDRSFLFGLEMGNPMVGKLVANIVRMIGDLGRAVICEGVETQEQARFLLSVGCRYAQGFLYDKPLPHGEYEKRLLSPEYAPAGE